MKLRAAAPLVVLLAFAAVCPSPRVARACSCAKAAPCEYAARASFVFTGVVTGAGVEERRVDIGTGEGPRAVAVSVTHVRVEEVFVGAGEGEVRLYGSGTTCGYGFQTGGRYLIYASADGDDKALGTSACSGTKSISQAEEDLAYLRGARRLAPGASAFGEVTREVARPGKGEPESEARAGVRVVFERDGHSFSATTDGRGVFALPSLPPGRYRAHTDPPTNDSNARYFDENGEAETGSEASPWVEKPEEPRAAWLVDVPAQGCVHVWFAERPEGEISGEVTGLEDEWLGEVEVQLLPAEAGRRDGGERPLSVRVDADRRFKFTFVPPGRYYLGFNVRGGPSLDSPFAESYYPAAGTRAEAQLISVEPGQKVRGLSLRMAPRVGEGAVEGVAVWPDGRPAAGVRVELTNPLTGYDEGDGAQTDGRGRFRLKCVEGQTYDLSALVKDRDGDSLVKSKPLRVTARATARPARLVVEPPEETQEP